MLDYGGSVVDSAFGEVRANSITYEGVHFLWDSI
jgi:hypothetical protein